MKKKYLIVILSLIITGIFIAVVSTSYAYLKREVDTGKKVELIVGTLNYTISSENLNNNRVVLSPNSTNIIKLNIESNNKINTKYELYYNIVTELSGIDINNIKVGYLETNIDNIKGSIESNKTITLEIVMINESDKNVEIEYGVQGGLPNAEFALTNGKSIPSSREIGYRFPATLKTGKEINELLKTLSGSISDGDDYSTSDYNITTIRMAESIPNGVTTSVISMNDSKKEAVAWYDSKIIYIYSDGQITLNPDSSYMFEYFESLNDISGLEDWNTANVTNMNSMFSDSGIRSVDALKNWDVSNVTNMNSMFFSAEFSKLNALANWNVSSVISMANMFDDGWIADLQGLENWDVSKVTNMGGMFFDNQDIKDLNALANWNVSNVSIMSYMFCNDYGLSDISALENWNVSRVTNMESMFNDCSSLNDLSPLNNWNTSNVTNMREIFANVPSGDKPSWYHE